MADSSSRRFGLSGRLIASIVGLASLTIIASGSALWGIGEFRQGFDNIVDNKVTRLDSIARLVQRSEAIAVIAPRIAASQSGTELSQREQDMNDQLRVLNEAYNTLSVSHFDEKDLEGLKRHFEEINSNLDKVVSLVRRRLDLKQTEKKTIRKLTKAIRLLDDLRSSLRASQEAEKVENNLRQINDLILRALSIESKGRLKALKKKADKLSEQTVEQINALSAQNPYKQNLATIFNDLNEYSLGKRGVFQLLESRLDIQQQIIGKLSVNDRNMVRMVSSGSILFTDIENEIINDRKSFRSVIDNSSVLLGIIAIAALLSAVVILFYTKRRVVNRLTELQQCMLSRANGKDSEIPTGGDDEITDMADSFSYFVSEIESREKALSVARDEAHNANKAKGDFLANMSHEIRTPMNAIIGLSSLILQTDMTERQKDYLLKIQSSSQALLGIINDILDFSKIEAGKLDMEDIVFDLGDVLNDVANLVGQRAEDKGLEIVFAASSDLPSKIQGDPLRLGQVLTNLCTNAVKFTDVGEIVVRCELLKTADGRAMVQFSVRDTGIGLTEEQQAKLFKAFSQADASTTREYGGTGLGLSICERLVGMMGGEIWVKSISGEGATFFFTAEFGLPEQESNDRRWEELRGARILVADDNSTTRILLSEMLASLDCEVTQVVDGAAALAEVKRAADAGEPPYKVVLMDWQMPEMDGLEASQHIKQDDIPGEVPIVIMVTGHGRDEVLNAQGDQKAIDALLVKPINPSLLFDTMKTLATGGSVDIAPAEMVNLSDMMSDENSNIMAGRRVLLVEDNEINQQVAREILGHWKVNADLANNGQEAIISITEAGADYYDAVLMDIQMPVMDGKTATRKIRNELNIQNLPIVAMTAHAMEEERKSCFEAGMNAHVSKPIEPALLFKVLIEQWKERPRAKGATTAQAAQSMGTSQDDGRQTNKLPDHMPGLKLKDGLSRVMGNERLYRKLLDDFAQNLPGNAEDICKELRAENWDQAKKNAHALKGVSGNIGAHALFAVCQEIEKLLKTNKWQEAQDQLERFDKEVNILSQSLSDLQNMLQDFAEDKPAGKAVQEHSRTDKSAIQDQLVKLKGMLAENDMNAMMLFNELNSTYPEYFADAGTGLEDAINALDFDTALNALSKLME